MTTMTKYKTYPKYKPSGVGWLGDIPEGWEIKKLKYVSKITLGKMLQQEQSSDFEYLKPYLRAENIRWENVDIRGVNEMWFSLNDMNSLRLRKKDLLVSEGGEVGRTAIWETEIEECYIQNSVNRVRVIEKVADPYFLLYSFESLGNAGFFEAFVNRVSIAHLTREKLKEVEFTLPPISEQRAIADSLDHETGKIDEVVAKKQKLMELLKEKRQALITHAVTKGLDPKAIMKPSGIDWLGDIPMGWEVKRLRYVLDLVGGNGFPEDLQGRLEGKYPFYKVSDINGKQLFLETSNNYVEYADIVKNNWKIVPKGSIVTAKIGAALSLNHRKITKIDALIDNNMLGLSLKSDGFDSMFIFYIFKIIDLDWFVNPGAVPSVNIGQFVDTFLPMPETKEQRTIADFLDRETARIDEMMKKVESQIEKLQEYRQALITNAVTGKIKV